jgi:cytoskeleton protein RodZ
MEKTPFGDHLRREREMRGVSLEEISKTTRIGVRFLEALEGEQWDRLPGGVFNRGFIRAVARYLGLDEERLVGEYALATNDRAETAVWALPPVSEKPAAEKPERSSVLLGAVSFALVVALCAGGWWAWTEYGGAFLNWRRPPPAPPSVKTPAPPHTGEEIAGSPKPGSEANTSTSLPDTSLLELKVEASKATEVSVLSDGKKLFSGRIKAGGIQRYVAKERFEVSVKDSIAILLELNGQTVPPLGQPGLPGSITLTRKDLKKSGEPH